MSVSSTSRITVTLLGRVRVARDGDEVHVGGAKARAILAMLALGGGEVVSVERLAAGLWGDDPPPSAATTLRAYVSRVRRILDPGAIASRSPGYSLAIAPENVDTWRFWRGVERAARSAAGGDRLAAASQLRAALDEWEAEPLADLQHLPFAAPVVTDLERQRTAAREAWAEHRLALGHHEELVPWLQRRVDEQPVNERLVAQLMLALYRSGQQAHALAAYQELYRALRSELGIQPGPHSRDVHQRILRQDPSLDLPVVTLPRGHRGNLPPPHDSFVGREAELDALRQAMLRSQQLTVVGSAGVGKSRVALEAARACEHRDGVWHVDLSGVMNSALVPTIVAEVLMIHDEPGLPTTRTLARALAGRDLLLLLDNVEQVRDGCAELADVLGEHVHVLVTSRVPLGGSDEIVLELEPLEVRRDDGGVGAAVDLFLQRAAIEARTGPDAHAVTRIVAAVGGAPLAIELAAARSHGVPLGHLADELERRHSTTLDWTLEALAADERRSLSRLSVFTGNFDLAAATIVCAADVTDQLATLVRRAIVTAEPRGEGEGRFRLLDSVRDRVRTLSLEDDPETVAARHASVYLELAERADGGLRGAAAGDWLRRLDRERPNLRAAIGWSLTHHPATAQRLAAALGWYWYRRGHINEGRALVGSALAAADPATPLLAARVHLAGIGLAYLGGDLAGMRAHLEPALAAARVADDGPALARCLLYAAWERALSGDVEGAWAVGREGADVATVAQATDIQAEAAMTFGMLERARGDLPGAARHLEQARQLADSVGHGWAAASATWIAGKVAFQRGDLHEAARLLRGNLRQAQADTDPAGGLVTVYAVAAVAVRAGRPETGAELIGAVEALGARIGYEPARMDPVDAPATEAAVRDAVTPDVHAAALERGRQLSWDDTMALADAIVGAV